MLAPALALLVGAVGAQPAPAPKGYVVRADSATVWLDLTAADGAAPGRAFEVYTEGPELRHPITGAVLGRVRTRVSSGVVVEVFPQYSTGRLSSGSAQAGQRASLLAAPAPTQTPEPIPASDEDRPPRDAARRSPKSRGAALDYEVVGMAVADFDGTGRPEVALASDDRLYLYAYPAADGKSLAEAPISGTGARVVGLSSARLDGDARASLLVSVYDGAFRRFETRVYKLESGRWLKSAEMPFVTRAMTDAAGKSVVATQQILDDSSFPLGRVYPLVYKDGRYAQGSPALDLARADWLFGADGARLGGEAAVLSLTPGHDLRVQFAKGHWSTSEGGYGQTPVRVRWGERLLEFEPPMAVDGDTVYAVRNLAALGGLGSPFGLFNRGEIVRKRWDGLGLEDAWRAQVTGCTQGLALAEPQPGRRELLAAVRGAAGRSSVWVYDP